MQIHFTILCILVKLALSQRTSPCPNTFSYEPRGSENDRWYGVLSLSTAEDLTGVWLHIILDRPADVLGNWFGEASSSDNIEYTVKNPKYKLEAGPPVSVRFFVKYDPSQPPPTLQTVRLNGKTICTFQKQENELRSTTPTLHISQLRPTDTSNHHNRPSGSSHENHRPSSTSSENNRPSSASVEYTRPTSSSNGNNRPSSSNNGSTRPSSSNNGNNRPSSSNNGNSKPSQSSASSNTNRPSNNDRPSSSNGNNNSDRRPSTSNSRNPSSSSSSGNNNSNRPSNTGRPSYNNDNGEEEHRKSTQRPSYSSAGSSEGQSLSNNNNIYGNNRPFSNAGDDDDEDISDSESDFFQGDFANLQRPAQSRPTSSSNQVGSNSRSCGTVVARAAPLISHGQDTWPGQWPWHVALYHSKGIQLVYTCGGTLITDQHVITAAHCVTKPHTNRVVNPSNILVYLGKYNLITFGSEVQDRGVRDVFIHPEYNHSVYFNDIAVLKLSKPVTVTSFVRPCCLWDGDNNLENVIRQEGTVVGWGFDENRKLSNKLMQAKMPIVSTVDCIYSNRDFFSQFTFEKNYCAGFRNGTSVCNGDSGGGMVFEKRSGQSSVWQIRGIVSVGVALQGQGICDTSQYIVFTDVAKHTHWIRQVISN